MSAPGWKPVNKSEPCPICGKPDPCKVSVDSAVVMCLRVADGAFKSTKGWHFHRLTESACRLGACRPRPTRTAHEKPESTGRGKKTYATPEEAIDAAGKPIGGQLMAAWTYHRVDGTEAFRVARYSVPNSEREKEYRPVHQTKDGWRIGDPSGKLPLYRMPELTTGGTVYICEGEKSVDAARAIGLGATTSAHGAGSAEKSDWTPLAGREVVILPDHDDAGEKYAHEVVRLLVQLDPPARAKILSLPGLPEHGDIVEYIDARDSIESESIREGIEQLAAEVPELDVAELIGGPVLTCLADVEPREVSWLWPGRIPLGRITLLVGKPGEGKSFLTNDIASRVSTGSPWPDGSGVAPKGSAILIACEDDPHDVIRPRLDAHHADVQKIHLLSGVLRPSDNAGMREVMFALQDVDALESALKRHRDCKLVVVDPVGDYMGRGTDSHIDSEVRAVLAPVAKLAQKYGPAVVVVAHRRKSSGTSADDLTMGSRGFTGVARAVWHLSRDPQNKNRRLWLPGKNNLAPEGDGLAFTIGGEPPRIWWESEPVRMSADDALAVENGADGHQKPGPAPIVRLAAEGWLEALLADNGMPAADVQTEAEAAGYSWRTVQRAAEHLRVVRRKADFGAGWIWELPAPSEDASRRCQAPEGKDNLASWHLRKNDPEKQVSACQVPEDAKLDYLGTFDGCADSDRPAPVGIPPGVWLKIRAQKSQTR